MINGKFVIFEGIDGSGKRTLAEAFANELAKRGHTIFDLMNWCKKEKRLPYAEEVSDQIIMSGEPTFASVGLAIREDLIKKGQNYDAVSIAHGYALDRMILYKRLILPALAAGKYVIQERGVPSSMVYQPIQKDPLSLEDIIAIPGNEFAIANAPGHIVIAKVSAKICMERLGARTGKNDNAIFEKESFLTKAAERYGSAWFKKFWEDRGTQVHYFDAAQPLEAAKLAAAKLADKIFPV